VNFSYGTVVWYQAEDPSVLEVDVAGTFLRLSITGGTEVQGVLAGATIVSGKAHRWSDGLITAQKITVVCPE
jgi:hypothetical protein